MRCVLQRITGGLPLSAKTTGRMESSTTLPSVHNWACTRAEHQSYIAKSVIAWPLVASNQHALICLMAPWREYPPLVVFVNRFAMLLLCGLRTGVINRRKFEGRAFRRWFDTPRCIGDVYWVRPVDWALSLACSRWPTTRFLLRLQRAENKWLWPVRNN